MQLNEVTSPVRQRRADDIQALIVRRSQQTPVFPSVITLAAARLLDKYTDKSHMSHSGRPASVIVGRRSAVDSRQVAAMLPDRQTDVRYSPLSCLFDYYTLVLDNWRLSHGGVGVDVVTPATTRPPNAVTGFDRFDTCM